MNAFVRRRVWKRLVAFIAHCFLTRQTGLRFLEVRRKFARWHSNPFARSEWIYTSLMNLVNKYIRPYICQPLLNKQALRQILASKCCDGNAGTYKKLTGGFAYFGILFPTLSRWKCYIMVSVSWPPALASSFSSHRSATCLHAIALGASDASFDS